MLLELRHVVRHVVYLPRALGCRCAQHVGDGRKDTVGDHVAVRPSEIRGCRHGRHVLAADCGHLARVRQDTVVVDTLATGLACNRILFGIGFLAAPQRAAQSWIGSSAKTAGGQVMVRAAGARDLALGAGALAALRSDADARPWFAAHLISDAADLVATLAARTELGSKRTAYALSMAGASTAIAVAYLARGETEPAKRPGVSR